MQTRCQRRTRKQLRLEQSLLLMLLMTQLSLLLLMMKGRCEGKIQLGA
jgi:hypothetical protein